MKIGLLTFQFALNYGALLQAYSLKKELEDAGNAVEIINYCPRKLVDIYFPQKEIKHPRRTIRLIKRDVILRKQMKLFRDFQSYYLGVQGHKGTHHLDIRDGAYDMIIVGSDQVWNTDLTFGDNSYFLPFEFTKTKKIGYGISIGSASLHDTLRQKIILYGNDFLALSFREKSASDLATELLGRYVEHVLDPVFLFSSEDWSEIEQEPEELKQENFIFFYSLEENQNLCTAAIDMSKESGLPIVSVHPLGMDYLGIHSLLKDVGPLEFLWLIHHADYVFTNSFHGLAFSVIFRKTVSVSLHSKLGERSRNLLNIMKISNPDKGHDIEKCDFRELELLKMNSFDYLRRCGIYSRHW